MLLVGAYCGLLTGCANPGNGPDGGPYDETPPRLVKLSPQLGAKNERSRKVVLTFDELIKVENAQEKVIVSPPQIELPEIKTGGRSISVELLDTLKSGTTYTIDFSDAIVDANEGNPLGRFTYFFSTGDVLDTMEVSGYVLDAETLEPVKGILVGLHPADAPDSIFRTQPFMRVARTDGGGRFAVKGVAQGKYRAYALKDMDGDFKFTRGEQLAFSFDTLLTSSRPDVRYDTLWTDTIHYDTIRAVPYTHFLPDDVVLLAFNEKNEVRQLLKTERPEPEWFRVFFTAPSKKEPVLRGLNFESDSAFAVECNAGRDTITYWLRDTLLCRQDTLRFSYTYECTDDSTLQNFLRTDTLEVTPRIPLERRMKLHQAAVEKWQKQVEKRRKRGNKANERPPYVRVPELKSVGRTTFSPLGNFVFEASEPAARFDTAGISLCLKIDSVFKPADFRLERDSFNLKRYTVRAEWRTGQEYEFRVDSAAFKGLSGNVNDAFKKSISISKDEEMGALFLLLPGCDTTFVVQLLDGSGKKAVRQVRVENARADFFYLDAGTYYLRLFIDENHNDRWDAGSYNENRLPEQVYYFPAEIEVRANWDIEQAWRYDELPRFRQKPAALIKQKADEEKKGAKGKNAEREREKRG